MDEPDDTDGALFEARVGTLLRDARLSRDLELRDIASETRVPQRHLEAIENGDYERLPAAPYSIGFVKSFAREVGLDAETIGRAWREEIRSHGPAAPDRDYFEATDPARVPPRSLAWIAALIALAILLGYGAWRSGWFGEDADDLARLAAGSEPSPSISPVDQPAPAPPRPEAPSGPVVLTATDTVWLRVYDMESDEVLFEGEMAAGRRYEVPTNVARPAVRVGRAEALEVTVGGQRVAPLGPPATTLADVSLRAADLVNRQAPGAEGAENAPQPGFGEP